MAEERHSFLQTAFMAVVGCTLVHIGFGLTGFDLFLHDFTDVLGGAEHGGEFASAELDPHAGHDHDSVDHSGVRGLYPQQEYSLAA